ncbi:MAG: cytochrome C [Rhodobacteraceae bacterium]|nr:cytochrome C [Paracoccaceae bacterium]
MKSLFIISRFTFCFFVGLSFAEIVIADVALGKKSFRKCKSCHMIKTDSNVFIQKGGKTGPNLWGLKGRVIGSTSYRYGKSIIEVGESGLVWDKKNFIEYVANPKAFLSSKLNDRAAKSKMSYKLKKKSDAYNIWAYLSSVSLGNY